MALIWGYTYNSFDEWVTNELEKVQISVAME